MNTDSSFVRRRQSTVRLFIEPKVQNLTKAFSQDFRYLHYVFKQTVRPQMKRSREKHVNTLLSNSILEGSAFNGSIKLRKIFVFFCYKCFEKNIARVTFALRLKVYLV